MDEYLKANIKGEYHEVRIGYFILSVPIEFADKLTLGDFSEVYNILKKASDEYNKNVISADKTPGQVRPDLQEKMVSSMPEQTINEEAPAEEEKSE